MDKTTQPARTMAEIEAELLAHNPNEAPPVADTAKPDAAAEAAADAAEAAKAAAPVDPTAALKAELEALKAELETFKGTAAEFGKFKEKATEQADAERVAALRELRKQRLAAIREGDDEAVLELEDRIAEAERHSQAVKAAVVEAKPAATKPPAGVDPVVADFTADGNGWLADDDMLSGFALRVVQRLVAEKDPVLQKGARATLEKAKEVTQRELPRRFKTWEKAQNQGRTSAVDTGKPSKGGAAGTYNGKTKADMTPGDRQIMREVVEVDKLMTEEEFLKRHFA